MRKRSTHEILLEQKWSKAKNRDANSNKVQFEEELYTRFKAEVPKVTHAQIMCGGGIDDFKCGLQMKLVTPSALVERFKINASLARSAIKELEANEIIKVVSKHHQQWIFTRNAKVRYFTLSSDRGTTAT
jgi:small subunit ribosomal protein S25e